MDEEKKFIIETFSFEKLNPINFKSELLKNPYSKKNCRKLLNLSCYKNESNEDFNKINPFENSIQVKEDNEDNIIMKEDKLKKLASISPTFAMIVPQQTIYTNIFQIIRVFMQFRIPTVHNCIEPNQILNKLSNKIYKTKIECISNNFYTKANKEAFYNPFIKNYTKTSEIKNLNNKKNITSENLVTFSNTNNNSITYNFTNKNIKINKKDNTSNNITLTTNHYSSFAKKKKFQNN